MAEVYYRANSNRLELWGLRDAAGAYISAAVVTATLRDRDGVDLPGAGWPLPMAYLPDGLTDPETGESQAEGCYATVLPYNLTVADDQRIVAVVVATVGALVGQWEIPVLVAPRDDA